MTTINQLMKLREDNVEMLLRYVKGPYPMPASRVRVDSAHADGHYKPRGWHTALRKKRKAQKLARRAQRGRR